MLLTLLVGSFYVAQSNVQFAAGWWSRIQTKDNLGERTLQDIVGRLDDQDDVRDTALCAMHQT
jgi:hypothetical protein